MRIWVRRLAWTAVAVMPGGVFLLPVVALEALMERKRQARLSGAVDADELPEPQDPSHFRQA